MRLYVLILLFTTQILPSIGQVSIMSYNIRYNNPNDRDNWWENRKEEVVDLVQYYSPDFLGTQEGLDEQVTYLNQALDGYSYIGVGRDGEGKKSEHVAIFYLTSKYDLIESRTFWLSPTPDQVSIGWDAALNRICTYGHFKDRTTGAVFHVFNCHFDHQGKQAREKSAEVILAKMKEWKLLGKNLVLTGDFNSVPTSKAIATIEQVLADSRKVSLQQSYGPAGTFNGFDLTAELDNPIDYIFVKNLRILNHRHIDDRRRNGLWVSDHLPVFATIITE